MNGQLFSVLVVSPDRALLRRAARFLELCGFAVTSAATCEQAAIRLAAQPPEFLVLDLSSQMPAALRLARLARTRSDGEHTFTLLVADRPSLQEMLDAVQAGCDDFLSRPAVFGEWLARLKAGARTLEFERRRLEQQGVDPGTRLASRAALQRQLQALVSSSNSHAPASLVLFQPDGGRALRAHLGTSAWLTQTFRAVGLLAEQGPDAALVAAWDETTLALLWPGQGEVEAAQWAEAFRAQLSAPSEGDTLPALSWSAGVAGWRTGQAAEAWAQAAEQALELADASGGDCVATSRQGDEDAEAWSSAAAAGKLFASTTARDVMAPCPLILSRDETVDTAVALLRQTALPAAPVVDDEGHYLGMVTVAELAAKSSRTPTGRQTGSVRLLRHFLSTDTPQFDERAGLAELLDFFASDPQPLAVVLARRRPIGLVFCDSLANLSERVTAEALRPTGDPTPGSEYLLIPEECEG